MTDKSQHQDEDELRTADGVATAEDDEIEAAVGSAPRPDEDDELARVGAERDEYLDHLRRLKAEFENYRKRVQRDNEELRLRAAEAVVESLLPVLDNMDRALDAAAEHEEGQLLSGVRLVADQLKGTLMGHGLESLDVEPGMLFDPTLHEAVLAQESDEFDEGQVALILERGYLLHGRLLRPAKVIVAR
jgi:molecular chaperone GrpE